MRVDNEVLAILSSLEIEGPFVKMAKMERGLYLKVDKVLEACGGKWDRRAKAHLFDGDARERIEQVLALGEVTTNQDLGFFATPPELARQLVEMADVRPGHVVLEPSAGDGAIVDAILEREAGVFAIERDDRRREALIQRVFRALTLAVVVHPTYGYDDFMEYQPSEPFDRVVMNPPFCKVGLGDHLDHVRHAFSMLVPSGMLVSVMPTGIQFRQDRRHREFREWVIGSGGSIQTLPEGSFKSSGTGVNTCVVRMRKGL
jgi:predicted RNA methylase